MHRGDIVEADVEGRLIRQLGDPDRIVALRSTVKPFGVVALIEAGGIEAFDLEPPELADRWPRPTPAKTSTCGPCRGCSGEPG